MKQLEKIHRKNGFDYEQVEATDYGYIYAQKGETGVLAYEVFKHMENDYYDCVSFPSNEAFGTWAWTYHKLEDAQKRLETLKPVANA